MADTRTINGHTYTRFYAWFPTRMHNNELVWFEYYYMRPDRNGQGILLSSNSYQLELTNLG